MSLNLYGLKSIQDIVVCCSSRHPHTDVTKFIEYLESVLSKVDKNKIICVMGDFNINLLNYECHNDTNEFNGLTSYASSNPSAHKGY